MAGALQVDPTHLTFGRLLDMAYGLRFEQWTHTATIQAHLTNQHRAKESDPIAQAIDFHPLAHKPDEPEDDEPETKAELTHRILSRAGYTSEQYAWIVSSNQSG